MRNPACRGRHGCHAHWLCCAQGHQKVYRGAPQLLSGLHHSCYECPSPCHHMCNPMPAILLCFEQLLEIRADLMRTKFSYGMYIQCIHSFSMLPPRLASALQPYAGRATQQSTLGSEQNLKGQQPRSKLLVNSWPKLYPMIERVIPNGGVCKQGGSVSARSGRHSPPVDESSRKRSSDTCQHLPYGRQGDSHRDVSAFIPLALLGFVSRGIGQYQPDSAKCTLCL